MRGKPSRTGRQRVRTVCGRSVVARVGAVWIALAIATSIAIAVVLSHVRLDMTPGHFDLSVLTAIFVDYL